MTALYAIAGTTAAAFVCAVASDLLTDVPRLAVWLARRAERLLPTGDRQFYGFVAETIAARTEAMTGGRSRLSVVWMATGMFLTGVKRYVAVKRNLDLVLSVSSPALPESMVKVWLPPVDEEGMTETVWAEQIGADLYRIDNHVLQHEYVFCGDVVRARVVTEDDYEFLEFAEVVTPATESNVTMIGDWRLFKQRRHRRLHRKLAELGMFVEWLGPGAGRSHMPDGEAGDRARALLYRSGLDVFPTERGPYEQPPDPATLTR